MAAAAAAFTFADEPVADVKVADFTGNAAVTWGVDLDTQKTGFKNEGEATLKVNIANKGSKSTTGEGVWAEIGVEATSNIGLKSTATATGGEGAGFVHDGDNLGKVKVSAAKLHFGDVYVGITSGDTVVGEFNSPNAVNSSKLGVSNTYDDSDSNATNDPDGHTHGIVAGYGNNLFDIAVDFRSHQIGTAATGFNYYTNDYGVAGEATLKFVPGLEIKAGADYQIRYNDAESNKLGVGASEKYTLALGDKFKLIEGVGFNMGKVVTNSDNPLSAGTKCPTLLNAPRNTVGAITFVAAPPATSATLNLPRGLSSS